MYAQMKKNKMEKRTTTEFVANFRTKLAAKKGIANSNVRTRTIGKHISRRCYPQTRGFGQFIPRDEADVAR